MLKIVKNAKKCKKIEIWSINLKFCDYIATIFKISIYLCFINEGTEPQTVIEFRQRDEKRGAEC